MGSRKSRYMVKVLTFGTFDNLHPGHIYFLEQASKFGELHVVVSLDETVLKVKGRLPEIPENVRLENVRRLKSVNKAYLGNPGDKYKIVEEIHPDIICLGYDQKAFVDRLPEELMKRNIEAKIIKIGSYMPETYKSSLLRKKDK
jgi:FAD synthetase